MTDRNDDAASRHEHHVKSQLQRLRSWQRCLFAAAAAERLVAALGIVWNDKAEPLERTLDILWNDLKIEEKDSERISDCIKFVMTLLSPDEDEAWNMHDALSDDAAAATYYALKCRASGDMDDAFWAARRVLDFIDGCVFGVVLGRATYPRNADAKSEFLPMRAEMARQCEDLQIISDEQASTVTEDLRIRSKQAGRNIINDMAIIRHSYK